MKTHKREDWGDSQGVPQSSGDQSSPHGDEDLGTGWGRFWRRHHQTVFDGDRRWRSGREQGRYPGLRFTHLDRQ